LPSEIVVPDLAELGRRLPVDLPTPRSILPDIVRTVPRRLHEVPL
jgi:hypothetical protein